MAQVRVMEGIQQTTESPLSDLLARPMAFSPDAWHVMQQRDEALIRDQVLHGYASRDFIYSFSIGGKPVTGISVVGARELASKYGGIKARIVATVEKRGALFVFRTFSPLTVDTRQLHDLADEDDFYECVMEISDLKSGNSIEVRKKEMRQEKTKDGRLFDRPHYDVIAESKAYRNGVLAILPQSVIAEFEKRCIAAGNVSKELTIDQLRDGCLSYATGLGLTVNRQVLASLTYAELQTLSKASKSEGQFAPAAQALGLIAPPTEQVTDQPPPRRGRPPKAEKKMEPVDVETGEIGTHRLSFAEVADAISTAKTIDDLQMASDLIRYVEDPTNQPELMAMYKNREAELVA